MAKKRAKKIVAKKIELKDLPVTVMKDTKAQRQARIEFILEYMRAGHTAKSSCARCGVSHRSFTNWVNKDPALLAEYEQVKTELHEQVGEALKLAALKVIDDPRYTTAAIFYLKAQAGWSDGSNMNPNQAMPSIIFEKK